MVYIWGRTYGSDRFTRRPAGCFAVNAAEFGAGLMGQTTPTATGRPEGRFAVNAAERGAGLMGLRGEHSRDSFDGKKDLVSGGLRGRDIWGGALLIKEASTRQGAKG